MHFILYGNDEFDRRRYVRRIMKKNEELELVRVDCSGKKFNYQNLINEYSMLDLFSSPKLIVAEKFPDFKKTVKTDKKEEEAFEKLLEHQRENPNIIVFDCDYTVYKSKKLFKLFKNANTEVIEFKKPNEANFEAYARTRLRAENIKIKEDAFKALVVRINYDKFSLENEICKFKTYGEIIDIKVIDKLVSRSYDDNAFHLINAIIAKDTEASMKSLHDLYSLSVDPNMIISLLAAQYRFLFQVRSLIDKGFDNDQIAKEIGLAKSGRVYYARKSVQRISTNYLLRCLHDLTDLEHRFKTINNINRNLEMELYILNKL